MKAATRSRWLELNRRRAAARRGLQLLEEKRQALIRAIARARVERDAARERAAVAMAEARAVLAEVEIELDAEVIDGASLAQTDGAGVILGRRSLLGVPISTLQAQPPPWRPLFAPGGTCESLDRAGAAFARALPLAVALAAQELTVEGLAVGLARTSRRSNALDRIVLPTLDHEIRRIDESLEEEGRDDAVRTRCRHVASVASARFGSAR